MTILNFLHERSFLGVDTQYFDGVFVSILLNQLIEFLLNTLRLNLNYHLWIVHKNALLTACYVIGRLGVVFTEAPQYHFLRTHLPFCPNSSHAEYGH